jgi:hypothetical protein
MDQMNRFEAAAKTGLAYVTTIAGLPLFEGSREQFTRFHELIGTPTLV